MATSAAAGSARSAVGDTTYEAARGAGTWFTSILAGFLFMNITAWLFQFIVIVVLLVVIRRYFKQLSWKQTLWYTYLIQGVIVTITVHFFMDKILKSVFGV